jgi:hypothetical protein
MKNVHVLPTDKPSRLIQRKITKELKLSSLNNPQLWNNVNIYITSDDKPKEGDWFYLDDAKIIAKYINVKPVKEAKKIILTTDQELIKAGVQKIDDEFLKWFVKNPSCESVEVDIELYPCDSQGNEIIFSQPANLGGSEDYRNNIKTFIEQEHLDNRNFIKVFDRKRFKIIIPQEEPKQETIEDPDAYWLSSSKKEREWQEEKLKEIFEHYPNAAPRYQYLNGLIQMALENIARKNFLETLEEAAERIYDDNLFDYEKYRYGFIEGAKWQAERMYSEAIEFAEWIRIKDFQTTSKNNWIGLDMKYYTTQELFEQFKKK